MSAGYSAVISIERMQNTMAKKLSVKNKIIRNILAIMVSAFYLAPFYIIISLSFKTKGDRSSHWTLPKSISFEGYATAWEKGKIGLAIFNTLIITVLAVVIILVIGSFASYPLARMKTKFNRLILTVFVTVMMVPPLSVLVPIYKEMVALKGINTYWGIIILTATYAVPRGVFMFTNFISAIPKELDEAALIDGCSQFMVFPYIILPNMMPVVSSVAILTGVTIWNDFSFQLYILQKPKMKTVTLAISSFFQEGKINLPAAAAAAVISVLPLAIIYICLQKYFVKGSMDSAVK